MTCRNQRIGSNIIAAEQNAAGDDTGTDTYLNLLVLVLVE